MNKIIPEIHEKRNALIKDGDKKDIKTLESWMIEEYFVPYQAS